MKTSISSLILVIVIFLLCVYTAFRLGEWLGKRSNYKPNGQIVLTKNEDGVDKIIFQLGMEYDDLAKHDYVIYKVVK